MPGRRGFGLVALARHFWCFVPITFPLPVPHPPELLKRSQLSFVFCLQTMAPAWISEARRWLGGVGGGWGW